MTPRPSFTQHKRAQIFRDNDGRCHICGRRIETWQKWQVEHVKARGFNGADTDDNLRPAHVDCHQIKTRKERNIMAKADAALLKHCGLDREKRKAKIQSRGFGS